MKPNIARTVLGGLGGTMVLTMLLYFGAPMMGVPKMDIAAMLGSVVGGWTMGTVIHFVNGVVLFPLIYAFVLFSKLRGTTIIKGISWGVAAVASLLGHIVYGALLGAIGGGPVRQLEEATAQS